MNVRILEDLQRLIKDKIKESLTLDYKSELGRNDEIAKDISAFANTLGGAIIYGVHEEEGLPVSFNWIESKGVKEKIESVILSNIQPKIEGYEIVSIENPDEVSKAVFVVNIQESLKAPHMVNHQYYKRYQFQSVPMEDHEVKEAIFKKGLRKGFEFEISQNLGLANKTRVLIERMQEGVSERRNPIVFTPFYTDAWRAVVSSGLLYVFEEKALNLVNAYSLIHEINHLIDCQKHHMETIVTPSDDRPRPYAGIWIPALIREKITRLCGILRELNI